MEQPVRHRRQCDGDPRAALKARVILRQLFNGEIVLRPGPHKSLWAEYEIRPGALVRVRWMVGRVGSVPGIPVRIRLKKHKPLTSNQIEHE